MLRDEKNFHESVRRALAHCALERTLPPILLILRITYAPLRAEHHEATDAWCWAQTQERISSWAHHMGLDLEWCVQENECHILVVANKRDCSLDTMATTLLAALKEPFLQKSNAHESRVSPMEAQVSLGISRPVSETTSGEHLEEMARIALKESLQGGWGTYRIFAFTPHALELALSKRQFILFYQPQYSLDGKTLEGVEALVRWSHPLYGLILPMHFIAVAERSGFIVALGDWVLRQACEDGKRWVPLRLGVNVSPQQFVSPGFIDALSHILQVTGMPPECLELELTEEGPITEFAVMKDIMERVRGLGVRLALDDFGQGWARFQELKRLTFDTLKLPHSLVEGMENDEKSVTLLRGLIRLGHDLGLHLIVEGVENPRQQEILKELECATVQGFLYAKPMPATDIDQLLISQHKNQACL